MMTFYKFLVTMFCSVRTISPGTGFARIKIRKYWLPDSVFCSVFFYLLCVFKIYFRADVEASRRTVAVVVGDGRVVLWCCPAPSAATTCPPPVHARVRVVQPVLMRVTMIQKSTKDSVHKRNLL